MFTGRKLPLTLAFVVLVALAFGASCKGFFVDPVLTSITINPTAPQVDVAKTVQLQVFGTYDDGTRKQVKSGVSWSSVSLDVATVDVNGVLTGVTPGTSQIGASAQGISGSATATVIGNVTAIAVTPTSGSINIGDTGIALTFSATPGPPTFITADNGGTLVITPSDSFFTCAIGVDASNNPAEICTATQGAALLYTIVMTYPSPSGGTVTSQPPVTITVH